MTNDYENGKNANTSQWIVSLAISIVCCAGLFVIFAGYLMQLHDQSSVTTVRLEALQERQNQLSMQIDAIRHPITIIQSPSGQMQVAPQNPAAPQAAPQAVPEPVGAPVPVKP